MRGRGSPRCKIASPRRCCRASRRTASRRLAAWSALSPAGCRAAAKSSSIPPALNSRCSTLIRDGSSACASAACRRRRPMPTPMSDAPSDAPAGAAFRAAGPLAPLQRAAMWTAGLSGWRRHAAALLLGALAAAPFSPIGAPPLVVILLSGPPVLLISFSGLVWLMDGCAGRRDAALLGWWFGFGFFLAGLYWISAALFVDIARFWWLVPPALLGFPAGFALFTALATLAAHEATRRFGLLGSARILVLAVSWVMAEWLRGHILTGFPWNLIGYAWAGAFPGALAVLQLTAVTGIYGLSLLTVLAAALPARLGDLGRGRYAAL